MSGRSDHDEPADDEKLSGNPPMSGTDPATPRGNNEDMTLPEDQETVVDDVPVPDVD